MFRGRAPNAGETTWLREDRDVVAIVLAERALRCERCLTWEDDWGTYDAQGVLKLHKPKPFRVVRTVCPGCELLGAEDHNIQEERQRSKTPVQPGLRVTLIPRRWFRRAR